MATLIDEDKIITIKTGSIAEFVMMYLDDQEVPEGISLLDYDIHIDFINNKTRVPIFNASVGNGIVLSESPPIIDIIPNDPLQPIDDGGITIDEEGDEYAPTEYGTKGQYTVNAGDTLGWPLGDMPIDIKYIKGGVAQHTETFILRIEKGISQ